MAGSPNRYTATELAQKVGGVLRGPGDTAITGLNSLDEAGPGDITFITTSAYAADWARSKASAVLISNSVESAIDKADARPVIMVTDAEKSMILLLELFQVDQSLPDLGIHPTAFLHPTAKIGQQVRIGPHVSIDSGCQIGEGVILYPGVRLYSDVSVGTGSILHSNVVIRQKCQVGRGVILHQGVSIGADGFGYRPAPNGAGLAKIPHVGNVIIEDGVEIGANSCVDRGKFGSTRIGAGTKIDNLCQIGHNCRIGRCCLIAALSGMAGSVVMGDGVQVGGKVGIADHLKIGNGAKIGAQSGVTRDIPAGASWLGYPADSSQSALRQWAAVRKLPDLLRRLTGLLDSPP